MQTTLKQFVCLGALAPALWLATGCAEDLAEPATSTDTAALTTADTDLPPECAGILTYINSASLEELYSYLPNNLADAIVARRAIQPYVSLADLSSVSGVAQGRLWAIWSHAVTTGYVDQTQCVGVYEELGVSASDRVQILNYVNTASQDELATVARGNENQTAAAIVAARPYTHLQQVADTTGVGIETFRSIRDAAVKGPFDLLVDQVNGLENDAFITTNFDWFTAPHQMAGRRRYVECFGVSQAFVDNLGGTLRPYLANGAEVLSEVGGTVNYANRWHEIADTATGLADLASLVNGQSFFGCYYGYEPDPWSGVNRAFFVNTVTGMRFFTETRWSE